MVIRNLRQKKIVNKKLIFRLIIIGAGIYLFYRLVASIAARFNQIPSDAMYTLGATLTFSGKIVVDNNFPNYTHSLTTND